MRTKRKTSSIPSVPPPLPALALVPPCALVRPPLTLVPPPTPVPTRVEPPPPAGPPHAGLLVVSLLLLGHV